MRPIGITAVFLFPLTATVCGVITCAFTGSIRKVYGDILQEDFDVMETSRTGSFGLWSRLAVLLAVAATLAGCASNDAVYREIAVSRSKDYERWLAEGAGAAANEPKISGKLTTEDAVKLALLYNKELQAAVQERNVASGRVKEAGARALPSLKGKGQYSRLDEVPTISFADQSFKMGVIDNYSADLVVTQPLYEGGAIRAGLRAARLNAVLADVRIRGQTQKTIFATVSTYLDALLSQHLYEVNRDAVIAAKAHLDDVGTRRKLGTASDYDVLRAEVDVSNFRAEEIRQRNRVTIAKTSLLKTMGVAQEQNLDLADDLVYSPASTNWEKAVGVALQNRPDLYEAELNVRLQREAVVAARGALFPKVSATFLEGMANPDPHTVVIPDWGNRWTAGVSVEFPIFDIGRFGKIEEEKARLRQCEVALSDTRERVLLEARQAWLAVRNAEEFVESQKMNLDRAAESLRLAEVGYRKGVQSQVEITDAQAAVTRTRGLYYQAIYDHCAARLALQRALGTLGSAADYSGGACAAQDGASAAH